MFYKSVTKFWEARDRIYNQEHAVTKPVKTAAEDTS